MAILSLSSYRPTICLLRSFCSLSRISRCFFRHSTSVRSYWFSSASFTLKSCWKSKSRFIFVTLPFQKLSSFLCWESFYSIRVTRRFTSLYVLSFSLRLTSSWWTRCCKAFLSALNAARKSSALSRSSYVFTFSSSSSFRRCWISFCWFDSCSSRSLSCCFLRNSIS